MSKVNYLDKPTIEELKVIYPLAMRLITVNPNASVIVEENNTGVAYIILPIRRYVSFKDRIKREISKWCW